MDDPIEVALTLTTLQPCKCTTMGKPKQRPSSSCVAQFAHQGDCTARSFIHLFIHSRSNVSHQLSTPSAPDSWVESLNGVFGKTVVFVINSSQHKYHPPHDRGIPHASAPEQRIVKSQQHQQHI
jgi:hypothetical protein